jgi:hypothetical protein
MDGAREGRLFRGPDGLKSAGSWERSVPVLRDSELCPGWAFAKIWKRGDR